MAVQTRVRCSKLVQPADGDVRNPRVASGGALLKWMDSTACLAAEKLAKCPAVTANMDDLEFHEPVEVGCIVLIESFVSRVFSTSMEILCRVEVEDMDSGEKKRVCSTAYFTFVALDRDGQKVKLPPVTPESAEEKHEYEAAERRRQVRLNRKKAIKETASKLDEIERVRTASYAGLDRTPSALGSKSGGSANTSLSNDAKERPSIPMAVTYVESTELVFANQTNHHGTLFGGQVLEWMCNAATMASSRLRAGFCTLRSIDDVAFIAPAKTGDRVFIRAQVNNTFSSSLEVGVRIDAYPVGGGEMKHINSGYLTLVAVHTLDKKLMINAHANLPRILCQAERESQQALEASARRKLRLDRRAIRLLKDKLAVVWDESVAYDIHLANISSLTIMRGRAGWQKVEETDGIRLTMLEEGGSGTIVRMDVAIKTSGSRLFKIITNWALRRSWDLISSDIVIARAINENCSLIHETMKPFRKASPTRQGPNAMDISLVYSVRVPTALSPSYVVAFRSVVTPEIPERGDFLRAEIGPSGFIVQPVEGSPDEAHLTFMTTMSNSVLAVFTSDLVGTSKILLNNIVKLRELAEAKTHPAEDQSAADSKQAKQAKSDEATNGCVIA